MTSAEDLENLPEFVRDSRLEARFWSDEQESYVSHPFRGSFRSGGPEEIWLHVKNLGIGGGGTVDLQKRDSAVQGKPCYRAVKCIRVPEERPTHKSDKYARELKALVKFSQAKYSDLFVASLGWFTSRNHIHIAMEFCKLGDLQKYLKKCPRGSIPENQARDIALQLLDALLMMHGEGFAHRDLKPANILITSCPPNPWHVKLSDFGISKRSADSGESTTLRGTPGFMPPEILGFVERDNLNHYAGDMWCFGETLFRMLAGRPTFSFHAHLSDYARGNRELPQDALRQLGVSEQAIDLFASLLAIHPAKRITAAGVSKHAWLFADIVQAHVSPLHQLHTTNNPELSEISKTGETVSKATEPSACWSTLPATKSSPKDNGQEKDETLAKPSRDCVLQSITGNKRKTHISSEIEAGDVKKLRLNYEGEHRPSVGTTKGNELQHDRTLQAREQVSQAPEQRAISSLLPNHQMERTIPVATIGSSHSNSNADDVLEDTAPIDVAEGIRDTISIPSLELDAHTRTPYLKLVETLKADAGRDTHSRLDAIYAMKVQLRQVQHLLLKQGLQLELKKIYFAAIAFRHRQFGREDRMLIEMLDLLSQFYIDQQEHHNAESVAKKALKRRHELSKQSCQDGDDEATIWTMSLLAYALQSQGKTGDLIPLSKDLVSRSREKWGARDLRTLSNMYRHARLLKRLKKYPDAEQLFRETAEIMQAMLGNHSTDTVVCKLDLALVLAKQNRLQDAKTVTKDVLRLKHTRGNTVFVSSLQALSSAFCEHFDWEMAASIDYAIYHLKGFCSKCGKWAKRTCPMDLADMRA